MSTIKGSTFNSKALFEMRVVPASRPLTWLNHGFDDLRHHPAASLAYGVIVSALGALILGFGRHPYFIAAAISGFLLIGPILSTGLCELSRQRQAGGPLSFEGSLAGLERNRSSLFTFAACLLGLSVAWFLLSSLMLYLSYGSGAPAINDSLWGDVVGQVTVFQILAYIVVGGVLAGVVFALSVITVPVLIDREVDASDAMHVSVQATLANLPAMAVWAGLIVVLTGVGYLTFMLGMVVAFPLLGHATWHAYKDLVQ